MKKSCPAREVMIGMLVGYAAATTSQMRPPHPVVGVLLGGDDCQYAAWSECEYSCGGSAGLEFQYSSCVTGPTSVPTLAMIASGLLAWLNSVASSGICACSAYWLRSPA